MLDRSTVMRRAWFIFSREKRIGRPFDRALFAQCLSAAWSWERMRAEVAAENAAPQAIVLPAEPVLSPLDAALDTLKYLPAHMSAARAAEAIRAQFAARA